MIKYVKFLTVFLLFYASALMAQGTGKISGQVIDGQTGEPLISANVMVMGTSLGSATNEDGEYMILNVPSGTYSVKASYIGYNSQIIKNIRVSSNLTTEANFSLVSKEFKTETVVVSAEKPLVDKNETNSISIVKSEDIENLPVRGVNSIVAQQAGVVQQGGDIHIRGSRDDATAFYIDGVLVNNPVFGGSQTGAIQNAIEEIQVQSGGYSAQFGGANGGIVMTQTKTGGEQYNFTLEAITDNFTDVGSKFLDTYTQGYSEYVVTAGGPVLPSYKDLRFFIAGQNQFRRTPAGFFRSMDYKNVFDPTRGAEADTFDIFYPNYRPAWSSNTYQIQGNLTWVLGDFKFRLNGNFNRTDGRNGVDKDEYKARESAQKHQDHTLNSSLKFTHLISNNSFYNLTISYFNDFYVDMDPYFEHQITMYGDSIANAGVGRDLLADSRQLTELQAYSWSFEPGNQPINWYRKQKTNNISADFNLLYQYGQHHEIKTGGEFKYYTIRRYSNYRADDIASLVRSVADGDVNDIYSRVDNYGYNIFGNETDEGLNGPKNPVFGAAYIQDKMEFSDLVFNLGFRFDYIFTDDQTFKNPNNIKFDDQGNIEENSLVDVDPYMFVSPRIGMSFPVTDRTVFHAQYGKFVQQSRLRDIYQGYNVAVDNIRGGYAISSPVGFGVAPEKTTQYEMGFRQQLGQNFAFDITGFYKNIRDQVQIRSIFAEQDASHQQYYAFVNGDFSTTKGLELKLDLRRTNRISAQFNYTFSNAQGTGSVPNSAFRAIWQSPTEDPFFPQQIAPLTFNQTHRGFITIDYRFGRNDGPEVFGNHIFSNFGANIQFSFNSGFNYTRWEGFGNARIPTEPLNASTTPWQFKLDLKIDKTVDVGPLGLNIYVWVQNLLDTRNVRNVFNTSGDAFTDGWLTGPGESIAESYSEQFPENGERYEQLYRNLYKDMNYNRDYFGNPRQLRLGVRLNY